MIAPLGQMGDAYFVQCPGAAVIVLLAGGLKRGQAAGAPHQNNVKDAVVEYRAAGLGNVSDVLCCFPDGEGAGVHSVHQHCSGVAGEQPQHAAKQSAFSHPIGAQDGQKLSFFHAEADVEQDLPGTVGKIQIPYFNAHNDPPFR